MNMTRILIFAGALVAAGLAAMLARGFIGGGQTNAEAAPAMEMTQILVAAHAIEVGTKINPGDLKWQGWPKSAVDPSFLAQHTAPSAMDDMSEGSVARLPLASGEPVTAQKIIKAEGAGFLAAVVSAGKRAVALKVSAERGAGGFILPNDRVDVILTRKLGNDDKGVPAYRTATVLRDIRVLAVDQTSQEEGDAKSIVAKTATLELSPQQAEIAALAEAMGDLSLSLRSLTGADQPEDDEDLSKTLNAGSQDEHQLLVLRFGIPTRAQTTNTDE